MDGPSAAFLQHSGNTNPAAAVGEGQPKPDLGMQLTEQTVKPVKIAALSSVSMEALQDYESFQNWIPLELTRALINAETAEVVRPGSVESAVESEIAGLAAAVARPGLAEVARALARNVLDNPRAVNQHAAAAGKLADILDRLRAASERGRCGHLTVVRTLTEKGGA